MVQQVLPLGVAFSFMLLILTEMGCLISSLPVKKGFLFLKILDRAELRGKSEDLSTTLREPTYDWLQVARG